MSDKLKYYLMIALNFALSMVLAASIFVLSFSVATIGIFSSSSYIESKLAFSQQLAIEGYSHELEKYVDEVNVPADVLTKSISARDMKVIFSKVTDNFLYSYTTRFSDDKDLYNSIKSSMTDYCNVNNISVSDADISVAACLAVDVANEYFGGNSTATVRLFKLVQSKLMVALIAVPAVLLVVSVVLLDLINYGRHRKFSYIGMGAVTGGYLLLFVPMFAKAMGYIDNFRYCTNPVYNPAIKACWVGVLEISAIVGVISVATGVVVLLNNYRYFKRKNLEFNSVRENNAQLRNEYLEELKAKKIADGKVHVPPSNPEEKIFIKIDFDDEDK